jgi:hypothetical protein
LQANFKAFTGSKKNIEKEKHYKCISTRQGYTSFTNVTKKLKLFPSKLHVRASLSVRIEIFNLPPIFSK